MGSIKSLKSVCICAIILSLFGIVCFKAYSGKTVHSENNAIYYWRTTFNLSDSEREFLREHDITKLYVRFFDVDDIYDPINGESVVPKATIQFQDAVPTGLEVVPCIYII